MAAHRGFDMKQNSLPRMTRKTFLKTAAVFSASALSLDMGAAQPQYESLDKGASERSPLTIGNAQWQLSLKPGSGLKAEVAHTSRRFLSGCMRPSVCRCHHGILSMPKIEASFQK
jgi:hypothetical protein